MKKKRWWIALIAIALCLAAALVVSVQRSHPAITSAVIDPTCTSSNPCIEYDNTSTGQGVKGTSAKGRGVVGVTTFNSTSSGNGTFGVFGNDASTSGTFDSGVSGLSVRGIGVSGQSTNNDAVFGTSTNLAGLHGFSTNNNGVFGDSKGAGASGVYGQNDGGGYGLAGRITNPGIAAVYADGGSNGVGAIIFGGSKDTSGNNLPALSVSASTFSSQIIDVCFNQGPPCYDGSPNVFSLDVGGNVVIRGTITTGGSCKTGCIATSAYSEKRVRFYTPRESLPTIEDFGEAQLVNGLAYVRIDPAFANTMDPQSNYMVFITPEGDSRGLFVTAKTLTGFAVRENQGGRSTLAFSYRIVAKPFGEHPVRLQMFTLAKPAAHPMQPTRIR